MSDLVEERIGTVDVWQLHHFRAPIQRLFARRAIDHLELEFYIRNLLATRRWDVIRVVPQDGADGRASAHVYAVYGRSWGSGFSEHERTWPASLESRSRGRAKAEMTRR